MRGTESAPAAPALLGGEQWGGRVLQEHLALGRMGFNFLIWFYATEERSSNPTKLKSYELCFRPLRHPNPYSS